ncbi:MAG: hypothetical protein Tsb009_01960 [Planctomycetaceae bacterium]
MSEHPDSKLRLRQAFEKHYDFSELKAGTIAHMNAALKYWATVTENPPVGEITDETMAKFRAGGEDYGIVNRTVNGYWRSIRAILRRLGPAFTGNPTGLGIIDRVPYMKPLKVSRKLPRRVSLDELSKFYIACNIARSPKMADCPPAEFWRALIVLAYFTGLRKGDLFQLRWSDFNLRDKEIHFTAEKTGKEAIYPLHDVAIEHVQRIRTGCERLFPTTIQRGGDYTKHWREILDRADGKRFTLHDIRRTAASEAERVCKGMGSVLLQHRPLDVTGVSYLNETEELREVVEKMRVPLAFAHGPRQAERAYRNEKKRREKMMREAEFRAPGKPEPDTWRFRKGESSTFAEYHFAGKWRMIGVSQWKILRAIATSEQPATLEQLAKALYRGRKQPTEHVRISGRVNAVISKLRQSLREEFELPSKWNPVPCVERGNGGKWTLLLPRVFLEDSAGGAG